VSGSRPEERSAKDQQDAILEILKANPGLTRDYAIQLAKEGNPGLFEDHTHRDVVMQNVALIKEEIARLQRADKSLTFVKARAKVQTAHPEWFKEFEAV